MACLKFVRSVWQSFQATSGLEPRLLNNLRVTAAQPGVVNFELDIEKEHTTVDSPRGNHRKHGQASMDKKWVSDHQLIEAVDLGGSLAVASKGLYQTGVSTDLNVTYLNSGGKVGDTLKAEVTCDKFGKTLAFTSVRFTNAKDELVARGSHTKYVAHAWKDERNKLEEFSPPPS